MAQAYMQTRTFEGFVATIAWDMVKQLNVPDHISTEDDRLAWYQARFLEVYAELLPKATTTMRDAAI